MEKYIGQELKGIISSVQVKQGTARESGVPYNYIAVKFINGFEKRMFLQSGESFAFENAVEMLQTEKVVEKEF